MTEVPLKCTQCGKEALDPFCIKNCPKHLCEECGPKCCESLPNDESKWPDPEKCCECPYGADDNDDYYPEEEEIDRAESDDENEAWEEADW